MNAKSKKDAVTSSDEIELIRVLKIAISLIKKNSLEGLYPLLENDIKFAGSFSKVISKHFKVDTFFEIDEIAGFFADVWKRWAPEDETVWMKGFNENYYLNVVDCYNIAPLDTPVAFSPNLEIKRTRELLTFQITPVFSSTDCLYRYLSFHIPGFKCSKALLDHFIKKSYNALLSRNLLISHFKSARERNKHLTNTNLKAFRISAELFSASNNDKKPLGSFTSNNLVLEYRPKFEEFQYNWNADISNLNFCITEKLIKTLNSKQMYHIFNFLSTEHGNNPLRQRLLTGVHFFIKGYRSIEDLDKFIFYAIALEALFSKDKYTPIRTTLADYVSLLYPISERLEMHSSIREIYDLRSKIFHSGASFIEPNKITMLQSILIRCILILFEMIRKYPNLTEATFFKYLLEKKLSVPITKLTV